MPPDLSEPVGTLMPPVGDEPGRRLPLPIERVAVSQTLDGAAGSNRGSHDRKQIAATNDLEAIRAWLNQYPEGGNTWRAYRKEAERFLGWAALVCKKPVSSLGPDDCARYRDFLTSKDMSPSGMAARAPGGIRTGGHSPGRCHTGPPSTR